MKPLFTITLTFAAMLLSACGGFSPKNCQEEIDDYVTYRIAVTNTLASSLQNIHANTTMSEDRQKALIDRLTDNIDNFEDRIIAQWSEGTEDFGTLLLKVANDISDENSGLALEILMTYRTTHPDLSPFNEVSSTPSKTLWEFTERGTGIAFSFYWFPKENYWQLMGDEETIDKYITDHLH